VPQISFDSGFKKKSNFDYPKLSLESNEKARVCVIDAPVMEYVHTLRKVITEDGKPIMETQRFGKNQERTREVPTTDFVGKFICLGEEDTLKDKEADPDNCPACKASIENRAAVDSPRRRFVVHVIKYQTKKGTFSLQTPFQIEVLAWEFAENRFTTLVDIAEEHGNLPQLDLCLGPCTAKTFQKYDIIPGGKCEWGADEARKKQTREVYQANKSEDLSPLLGRKVSPEELRSQVNDVVNTYNYAFGRNDTVPTANTNAANDLSGLLDDPAPTTPSSTPSSPETSSATDDPWATPEMSTAATEQDTRTPKSESVPAAQTDEFEDLDSLLSNL
jgi:hypothetical protein